MTTFDVIVIGAGHNGLVTAAYLARAGRKVLVLERRDVAGGQLVGAMPDAPGLHASNDLRPDIVRDLELAQYGLAATASSGATTTASASNAAPYVVPLPDGGTLVLRSRGDDPETLESIRRVSPRDAERWPQFVAFMETAARFVEATYATTMPRLPHVDVRRDGWPLASLGLKLRRLGRNDMFRVMRALSMSAVELTEEWFEFEPLKAAIGALAVHGVTLGAMGAGGGVVAMHHWLNRGGLAHRTTAGGGARLRDALVAALRARGGELRTSSPVAQIMVDRQQVLGVRLATGEEIRSGTVVSAADPRHTLLDLVGAPELPPEFVWDVGAIHMRGSVAKLQVTTDGRHGLPEGTVVIAPTLDYLEQAYDAAKYGEVSPEPYLEVTTDGANVAVHFQFAPHALRNGAWPAMRSTVESRTLATLGGRYPQFAASVRAVQVTTPLELEQTWGLTEGDLNHGQLTLDQMLFMRPLPGWSDHRTPIDGLYLCGSGCHGGGGISGVPGRNAAKVIVRSR